MDIYPAAKRRVKYPPLSPTPGEAYRSKCYGLLKGFSTISFSTSSDLSLHDNSSSSAAFHLEHFLVEEASNFLVWCYTDVVYVK